MLMVNPERRATVEDIANHWWVNWGWKSTVCDCQGQQSQGSPMLARFIDWQNQNRPGGGGDPGKSARAEKTEGTAATAPHTPTARRGLKKAMKENEGCGGGGGGGRHVGSTGEDKQGLYEERMS